MRYGIFSDVHGNIEALRVVLDHLKTESVDTYVFLGDAVGYGANPNEVCDLIRPLVSVAIVGNHDAAVAGRMDYSQYYDAARQALDWCATQLSAENMAWLKAMPYKERNGMVEFCHGAPLRPEVFDYLFIPEQVTPMVAEAEALAPVTFIGHSHLTISFRIAGDRVTALLAPEIVCDADAKYIITVGSVGQPRDRDPRACCGVFDSETRTFAYHRLDYDKETTRQKIIDAGLAPVFGDRLLVGM
ncbi:MAG: metallophosphoesterase family protein [Deltaproteobacteria bacterium]|nr:metallophosphoesterase family protein [Deltaproteobacteria bacterium]